jgi:hypothetical protein
MPEIELLSRVETNTSPDVVSVRETRFDPPHEVARGEIERDSENADQLLASPVGAVNAAALDFALSESGEGIAVEVIQQFRLQAQQLAGHLETRQQELDRREAELNAHLAQHETSTRNARLWFQENHHDLEDRKAELERREQLCAAQLAEWNQRASDASSGQQIVVQLQQDSAVNAVLHSGDGAIHELELRRRQIELDDLARQLAEAEQEFEGRQRKLSDRQKHLEQEESLLARGHVELEDARKQFETEREEVQARLEEHRRKLAANDERQQIEFKKQREAVANRSQFLERRSASLDQLRAELLRLQRETLEMRLATEELWGQMSGSVPPATVTQSLARLRAKLAEHYRLQAVDIATQRKDLEDLAAKVTQQHQQVSAQKRELDVWIAHQHSEIESQAARLVAREEELDREQDRTRQQHTQWVFNRRKMEAEIRRLQNEARRAETECVGAE